MKLIFMRKPANIKLRVLNSQEQKYNHNIAILFYIKLLHDNQILKYNHKFCLEFRKVTAVLGHIYRKIMRSDGIR